jgi:UDP-N-acetylmuramoyl-L-alanyl-D-glutamate--2,6-diaminopimelate ligase
MKLMKLIESLEDPKTYGSLDAEIKRITVDSRRVEQGDMFVAIRGTTADGHEFVEQAIARGATAVVTDTPIADAGDAAVVVVDDTSKMLAGLASRFYGDPADRLHLCGITGTNGKTSTAHMYRSIVEASGWGAVGIIGTLGHGVGGDLKKTAHTTPDPVELHGQLRKMVDSGCSGVVMEVSSHAVRQHRTWGLNFDVGILTNVTHDHLDFHKTIDDYRSAKREFCESLVAADRRKPPGTLVYSSDDPVAREIGEDFSGSKTSVEVTDSDNHVYTADARDANCRVRAHDVGITLDGTTFTLEFDDEDEAYSVDVSMKLLGSFCAVNAALAAAGARATGVDVDSIKRGLELLDRIPGRFETIGGSGRPVVVLDYSHTPDSMERILRTCRELNPDRLVTVFGSGGDRDRAKRPEMGRIAQELSDFVYITTDNPRTEPIDKIVEEILAGMNIQHDNYRVDLDRGHAIHEAIDGAGSNDVIALLGKGAENYQIVGAERSPFSDRMEAEGALRRWTKG